MQQKRISFIGAGNMTKAIIGGLVNDGYQNSLIMASNRSAEKLTSLKASHNINTTQDNKEAVEFAEVLVLAVKPQMMESVCSELTIPTSTIVVSIAAGLTVKRLESFLNNHQKIVRVMPNTPSSISEGMSGLYATNAVSQEELEMVNTLMQSVGKTVVVKEESDINIVIAAAGSSPAYFFLIAESMQHAAMEMGLNKQQARELVQQAMLGSAKLMQKEESLELSELRKQVTSKGGTTAKAVESLQESQIEKILAKAMQAAVKRAEEMSSQI